MVCAVALAFASRCPDRCVLNADDAFVCMSSTHLLDLWKPAPVVSGAQEQLSIMPSPPRRVLGRSQSSSSWCSFLGWSSPCPGCAVSTARRPATVGTCAQASLFGVARLVRAGPSSASTSGSRWPCSSWPPNARLPSRWLTVRGAGGHRL